jgi:Omp85 superfamily domain
MPRINNAVMLAALWAGIAPVHAFADQTSEKAPQVTEKTAAAPEKVAAADDKGGASTDKAPPSDKTAEVPEDSGANRPGFIKRRVRSFLSDDDPNDDRGLHFGPFRPRVEILSSGSRPGPMLHFWAHDIGGTAFDVHASGSYSIYGYQYYDLQMGLVPHDGRALPHVERGTGVLFPLSELEKNASIDGFNVYVSARYRDYPKEDFYGVGASSLRVNRTDYRLQDSLYEGIIRFKTGRLSMMGRAGLLKTLAEPGTDSLFTNTEVAFSESTAPGLTTSPDFVHLSAAAWIEGRDRPANPHRGLSLGLAFSRFDQRNGHDFSFSRLVVDAREYLPLGSNRHVIALRQVALLDKPDEGNSVPFYMQASFGGSTFLRGYGSSRFRDNKLVALAAEYRFGLTSKVQLALIYEGGQVFPTFDDFERSGFRTSYGAGIRLMSTKKVHFRLDVLRSPERTRIDVKLGPSF